MIDYDPHDWWGHFFDIRGSMLREISGRVIVFTIWAVIVVVIDELVDGDWSLSLPLVTAIGSALAFLLVFRTNAAYDKFWEGRKLWGGIVNECRNLARMAVVHLEAEPVLRDQILRWASVWPYTAMQTLRRADCSQLPSRAEGLPGGEVKAMAAASHPPLAVATRISQLLLEGYRRERYSDIILTAMDNNVQLLIDYIGGCERILKTPLPFAYMVHVRRALILYCIALPFALVQEIGWAAVPDTAIVAFIFFGIEEIGVFIEDPFGLDENDLPLEGICATIAGDLKVLVAEAGLHQTA